MLHPIKYFSDRHNFFMSLLIIFFHHFSANWILEKQTYVYYQRTYINMYTVKDPKWQYILSTYLYCQLTYMTMYTVTLVTDTMWSTVLLSNLPDSRRCLSTAGKALTLSNCPCEICSAYYLLSSLQFSSATP